MKKKSLRIQKIIEINLMKERQLAKRLGDATKAFQAQQNLLQQLHEYFHEYQKMFESQGQAGYQGLKAKWHVDFLNYLKRALDDQEGQVVGAQNSLKQEQLNWLQAGEKIKNLEKIKKREHVKEERKNETSE